MIVSKTQFSWSTKTVHFQIQFMWGLCDDSGEGMWVGHGSEVQEEGDICTQIADSLPCPAETNTTLQIIFQSKNLY